MLLDSYAFVKDTRKSYYEFYSEGPRGRIKKAVVYIRLRGIKTEAYNLSFGDWDDAAQTINDKAVTNNADRDKILVTVAFTVLDFIETNPEAFVFLQGSTESRTRLYQMNIWRFWKEINVWFIVRGFISDRWENLQRGTNYSSFLLEVRK
ncbi:DUF6934 family protein [Filimonas effusa]|uniref:Uncharacterized protein n=1 Tax=Filimonas effusa TaxID=2508721 RepID=A0A4Q1D389_9BACT|nr:hypothetical protein [Filimonas effusa]RXK82825.1 hypothetical protein ESB13_11845 [Filimonas effusa]